MFKAILFLSFLTASFTAQAIEKFSFRGHEDAKVTLIVFGDFQCPFTKRGVEVTNKLLVERADEVKVVYRHFPLDFHPQARPAAIATVCADQQGEFWKLHDALFAIESGQMTAEAVEQAIEQVGLNNPAMSKCRESAAASAVVDQDMKEALLLGLMGTPTYIFVGPNGVQRMVGAYPLEKMLQAVDAVK